MKYVNIYSNSRARSFDGGLRDYLYLVYRNMGVALLISGLAAFTVGSSPALLRLFFANGFIAMLVMFAPFIFVLVSDLGKISPSISVEAMKVNLFIFAVLMGISLSTVFVWYAAQSVTVTFLTTALTFGSMSLYGYTTKRDLSGLGSFLFMGLLGIIIANIFNIFLKNGTVDYFLSLAGVVVFVLFTAFDIQRLKVTYSNSMFSGADDEMTHRLAIRGALELYLDFVNLFMYLLRFLGKRKND